MKLLVVRPQPGADATASRVRAAGFEPLMMPLFTIEPTEWDWPDASAYDALLLTSGNAVRMAGPGLRELAGLPIYAIGAATAGALAEADVSAFSIGTAGIEDMVGSAETNGHRNLLWLAGEDRTEAKLPAGMTIDARTVYRSALIVTPHDFANTISQADAVLLHSARAAQHFAELCDAHDIHRPAVVIAVLSAKIAQAAGSGWRTVVVATEPNDSSLLSALQRHFTMPSCDP